MIAVDRRQALAFRIQRHQLDAEPGGTKDVALLDYGVQDTGTDGAAWALRLRGAAPPIPDDHVLAWTLRGAPHVYRRSDVGAIALATAPFSEADAAKRIFDAAKALKDGGLGILDSLRTVAEHLNEIAAKPLSKGDASSVLAKRLDPPFLRACRPCKATHTYEQVFRLSALQAGLELEPATSPPVLRRIPKHRPLLYKRRGSDAEARFHVVRNYLRFYGPATYADAAAFVDTTTKEVKAQWPDDAVEVEVDGERRWILEEDAAELQESEPPDAVRLLAPFDPYLQARDRELLVGEEPHRKDLWRILGRPGAIVARGGEIVGTWRPKQSNKRLEVHVEWWRRTKPRDAVQNEAERLAAHRGVDRVGVVET